MHPISMTTSITLCLLMGIFTTSHGSESEQFQAFIEDIIETFQLKSPTVVFNDDLPNMCMIYQWLLCLSNRDTKELANNLASVHIQRKQDGIIYVGHQGHEELFKLLSERAPSVFAAYPLFMPKSYQNDVHLRLDSNIYFYEVSEHEYYELFDIFAVTAGPSIVIEVGNWSIEDSIVLIKSMNRWDRRTNLHRTRFINCIANNPPTAELIKDRNGSIIGSKGPYQDLLYYITDQVNLTVETIEAPWKMKLLENGSWTSTIGYLQRKEADVVSSSLGINLQRSDFIDYPIQVDLVKRGLCAILPIKGAAPNTWVYINVFGLNQWMIFIILLILIVNGLTVMHAFSEDQSGREFGTKRGSNKNYWLDSASSALAMVFLFTLQMGSHTNSKQLAPRLLTLTMSILTLLFFVFYAGDITAKMTSGSPKIPINNFEDVIYFNYKVVTTSPYYAHLLSTSKLGSAKRHVFDNHFEMKKDPDEVVSEMIRNPKTLYFGPLSILKRRISTETHKAIALKIDDPVYGHAGLGLQKNSEFLPLFNHFILKGFENGILWGIWGAYYYQDPEENFEMMEPQPLGLNNVMFCFISFGIGICVSIINVMIELIRGKKSKKQVVVTPLVKKNERKDARWATGRDIKEVK